MWACALPAVANYLQQITRLAVASLHELQRDVAGYVQQTNLS